MGEVIIVEQTSPSTRFFWFLGILLFVILILIPIIVFIVADIEEADSLGPCTNCEADIRVVLQNEASGLYLSGTAGVLTVTRSRSAALALQIRGTDTRGVYTFNTDSLVVGGRNGRIYLDTPKSFNAGTSQWHITNTRQIISAQQQNYVMAVVNQQLVYRDRSGLSDQSYEWVQVRI